MPDGVGVEYLFYFFYVNLAAYHLFYGLLELCVVGVVEDAVSTDAVEIVGYSHIVGHHYGRAVDHRLESHVGEGFIFRRYDGERRLAVELLQFGLREAGMMREVAASERTFSYAVHVVLVFGQMVEMFYSLHGVVDSSHKEQQGFVAVGLCVGLACRHG